MWCGVGRPAHNRCAGLEPRRADAVVGDEGFWIGEIGRDAGGGDGIVEVDARGDFEVEVEELLEEVAIGGEAVGGEDGDGRASNECNGLC